MYEYRGHDENTCPWCGSSGGLILESADDAESPRSYWFRCEDCHKLSKQVWALVENSPMTERYDVEVHYLMYDTVRVSAKDEQEAHEKAKNVFETMANGRIARFIRVTACGTSAIDGELIDDEFGEHTTEWD